MTTNIDHFSWMKTEDLRESLEHYQKLLKLRDPDWIPAVSREHIKAQRDRVQVELVRRALCDE